MTADDESKMVALKMPQFNFHLPLTSFRVTLLTPKQNGGRSSTVELQIVVLDVAGSSPVDHPTLSRHRARSFDHLWSRWNPE